ncbi:CgeB family protein [Arthrobacter oryzae]|uniref:Spore maturation protein CgeB n=1 Tax=Arthrobacter oryzae TaxID=409290 RepID=A0A495EQS7_9MICC|nr:glycosyltransferase [Arthrobacter oryzae]RKR18686.1 spore maturation protein CgeB [Arthrobacter oryzae]
MLRTILDKPRAKLQRTWHDSPTGLPRTEFRLDPRLPANSGIALVKRSQWLRAEVAGNSELTVKVGLVQGSGHLAAKAGVIWIKYLDRSGGELASEAKLASGKNGHYVYLIPGPEGVPAFTLRTPTGCASVALGFAAWKATPGSISLQNGVSIEQTVRQPLPTKSLGQTGQITGHGTISPDEDSEGSLVLGKSPVWSAVSLHETKDLEGRINVLDPAAFGAPKVGVVIVKFLDKFGTDVSSRVEIPTGPLGDYFYIEPDSDGQFIFRLHAPDNCVTAELGFAAWNASAQRLPIRNGITFTALPPSAAEGLPPGIGPLQSDGKGLLFNPQTAKAAVFAPSKAPTWIRVATRGQSNFKLTLDVVKATGLDTARSGLLRVACVTSNGTTEVVSGLDHSQEYGAYAYIDARTAGARTFQVGVPRSAVELRVAVQTWEEAEGELLLANELQLESVNDSHIRQSERRVQRIASPPAAKQPKEFKVAIICDEFTYNSFKYEFDPIVLDPATWQQQLEEERPDLFLCESAWSGVDSRTRPWKGRIYASSNFAHENRREVLDILEWCRAESVPTVFWNKEDPTHYPDRVHDFVDTAVKFDHVFTTDRNCVEKYRDDYGHPSVHCLPFATQPKLFNPIGGSSRTDEVVFAGSWYANHQDRSAEMLAIFRQIMATGRKIKIFDRFFGSSDELHIFPSELLPYTVPAVSHAELASVYKSSIFGLNINTVTGSSTMFARRVFELMSSNTLVLSNDFAAAEEFFGDTLAIVGRDRSALVGLTPDEIERKRDSALHNVLEHHTYRARFEQILDVVGSSYQRPDDRLTVVYPVVNAAEASAALSSFSGFSSVARGVLLLLSPAIPDEEVRSLYSEFNKYGATVVSVALALRQGVLPESLIPTTHFVVLAPDTQVTPEDIRRAKLHTAYVDSPIVLGSGLKYEFTSSHKVADIIAPQDYIETVLQHAGAAIGGDFYHV